MATGFNTQVGNGEYRLQFETDNREYYLLMQETARRCVDGKHVTNADRKNGNEYFLRGIETAKEIVKSAPIEGCVPVNELLKLRDWLYENDAITMNGVKQINQLMLQMQKQGKENDYDYAQRKGTRHP